MAGERRRLGRVARGKTVEPAGLDCRKLEELPRLSVFHRPRSPILMIADRHRRPVSSCAPARARRQHLAQSQQGSPRPRLHRSERPAQPFRDLRLGQLRAVGKDERRPLLLRQLRQCAARITSRSSAAASSPSGTRSEVRAAEDRATRRTIRSRAAVSCSSMPAADESGTRFGRRPAARSRSTVRLRAIVWSHAASEPVCGLNSSARFQSARNVSCTTSSATCRSEVNRIDAAKTASACRSYRAASASCEPAATSRTRAGVVARDVTVAGHRLRALEPRRFRSARWKGRRSKPLERTTSVSVVNTWRVACTRRRMRSKSRVSRARILIEVVGFARDVVALLDLGDRREVIGQVGRGRARGLGDPREAEDAEPDRGRVDDRGIARDHAARLELLDPLVRRRPAHPDIRSRAPRTAAGRPAGGSRGSAVSRAKSVSSRHLVALR